jgi:hypothetical protein
MDARMIRGIPRKPNHRPSTERFAAYLRNLRRPRKQSRDKDDGGVPVEPTRPNTLSGGAAAELEFDD